MSLGTAQRFACLLGLGASFAILGCRSPTAVGTQPAPAQSSRRAHAPLSSDPELAAAERAAIVDYSEFRRVLERAETTTQGWEIEAVIAEGAQSERLWLMNLRALPGAVEGVVRVEPKVLKSTQRGQRLVIADEDVVDWFYYDHGKAVGGKTRLIAERRAREAELADALTHCHEPRYADGCAALGERYATGQVGERRLDVAFQLDAQACTGGSAYGCNAAGWASLHGRGAPQDLPAAAAFFERACTSGDEHPFACDSRGFALLSGLAGTPRDLRLGQRLLSKACARGLPTSCLLLELMRAKGLRQGSKLPLACNVSFSEQVSRCSNEQDPEACFLAGSAFEMGICEAPKSSTRAAELLRSAATFGARWPSAERESSQGTLLNAAHSK